MKYITREGPISATVDVETALTTLYDDTAPGPVRVPSGATKIKQIIVGMGCANTAADGNANFLLRLSGDGLVDNEQTLAVCNTYQILVTAGDTAWHAPPAKKFDVDMDVKAGGTIAIFGAQAGGVTVGIPEMSVALGFA